MMDGGNSETHRGAGGGLADVGAMLRDRRVELKQDIATVARQTHIKVGYLKAIEEGRRRDLPGAAYTIGFVRTYADYLGFDGNRLVNDFHNQLAGDRKRAQDAQDAATEEPRVTISPVAIAAGVLTLALVGFFAWGYFSDTGKTDTAATEEAQDADGEDGVAEGDAADEAQDDASGDNATDQAASTEAAPAATPDAPAGATAPASDQAAAATAPVEDQLPPPEADAAPTSEQDPAQPQEAAVAEGAAGKIVLRAKLESWVQVTNAKSEAIFSRVLRAGETYVVPNEPGLMLTTGNAGGVEILLDGKKLKSLGSVGLVRRDVPLDPKKLKDGSAFKPASATPVTQ
jgi:cytoskeleton protein RodZ